MLMITRRWIAILVGVTTLLSGCAGIPSREALQVAVSGVEALPGEGLELRLLLKLRVQNPTDTAVQYDGISVKLDVQGSGFATGVSDTSGSVPRFGEAVIQVPVTVSALRMARQVLGMLDGEPIDKIRYVMTGRLSSPGFGSRSFRSSGELALPAARPVS